VRTRCPSRQLARILTTGVITDAAAGLTALLPLIVLVVRVCGSGGSAAHASATPCSWLAFFVLCFDFVVEYFFFAKNIPPVYNHLAASTT
jgi:hypothetical protein